MKLRVVTLTVLCFMATTALVFTSCQTERDTDLTIEQDAALLERDNDDVYAITEEAAIGNLNQFKQERGCATIIRDTLSSTKSITVDFGPINCLCQDGKNRRGKIIRYYTGAYKAAGSVHTIVTEDFAVNDNLVFVTKTVTNNGANAAGNLNYTIVANDSVVKANNAGIITWASTRNREYTAGANTAQRIDDKYSVTGTASGLVKNGLSWSMNISAPLVIDHSCIYKITSGIIQLQPQGKALRTIDYGSGVCDNDATVTVNNIVKNIKFK
jgi:hypothetical protein